MDGGAVMILGKLALTFGCLIGIPARELWCLRRERRTEAAQLPGAYGTEDARSRPPDAAP